MNIKILSKEYAKATEWNLATLEEMALLKGTSASRLERQAKICASMLDVCARLDKDTVGQGRTARILKDMQRGETAVHAVAREVNSLRGAGR